MILTLQKYVTHQIDSKNKLKCINLLLLQLISLVKKKNTQYKKRYPFHENLYTLRNFFNYSSSGQF